MLRSFILLIYLFAAPVAWAGEPGTPFRAVTCEGKYKIHLQGVCTDEQEAIFWCFTTRLVKTDGAGKITQQIEVADHHGDLCYLDGKLYVAVNLGLFNHPQGKADSWVYVYDAKDLTLLAKHPTPEVIYGAGGIAQHEGKFLVVGGLPEGATENLVYEYDVEMKFIQQHNLPGGYTVKGIQTATFADDHWWFGCYGKPQILLKADATLQKVERFEFDCSLGIVPLSKGQFLVARGPTYDPKGCIGSLVPAEPDDKLGLKVSE